MKMVLKTLLWVSLLAAGCGSASAGDQVCLIPAPLQVEKCPGQFQLASTDQIVVDREFRHEAELLAAQLRSATGYPVPISSRGRGHDLVLTRSGADSALGAEGYTLSLTPTNAVIRATTGAGIFYGCQSLLQLLPPQIFASQMVSGISWVAPCVEIRDQPRFAWRGFMLDVSRHFFSVSEVETVIDLMSRYKLNTFHWHLVDDQGWRIEIKKYPKLTSVGAWRCGVNFGLASNSTTAYDTHGRYGGFYTQAQIREVVAYAAARHVTIVPEIEMPGHSIAALAAYPQFSCTGGPFSPDQNGGVFAGIYNVSDEATYQFLGDILREVARLFPGKFIHIGGDEVPKKTWHDSPACQAFMKTHGLQDEKALQAYFTGRIESLVNATGKRIIGWSEIREGGLTPRAALMDWIGGGLESAASGHDVVMTPAKFAYFDYYQSTNHALEPKAIGGYLPLQKVYLGFEPIPAGLAPALSSHVLGGQANLWTEYIPNLAQVEYMMFPRLGALAEVTWSPAHRDWEDFKARTAQNELRLDALRVNYRPLTKPD